MATTKVFFIGNRESRVFEFPALTNVEEMRAKTLASFEPADLQQITMIHIFKDGVTEPTCVPGPF
jgi:hypothetical protein